MGKPLMGRYRAVIVDTEHPDGLMMARAQLLGFWDGVSVDDVPWAEYHLPIGGGFVPCQKGDLVWVEFPYNGDSRRPMITGAAQDAPAGKPNLPPEAWGGAGAYEPPRKEGQPPAPPITPTKDLVYKRNGLLERRTAGGGWSVTHTATGTEISFNDAGEILISGAKNIVVDGADDVTVKAGKNMRFEAKEAMQFKAGQGFEIEAGAEFKLKAAGVDVEC